MGEGKLACHRCHGKTLEDCSRFYNLGKIEWLFCYGQGKISCPRRSGSGKNYVFEYGYTDYSYEFFLSYHKCKECKSTAKVNCNQCYSTGKINCPNWGAEGESPYNTCYGKLTEVFGICGGEGTMEISVLKEETNRAEVKNK